MASSSEEDLSMIRVVVITGDFLKYNYLLLQKSAFSGPINGLTIGVYLLSRHYRSIMHSGEDGNIAGGSA